MRVHHPERVIHGAEQRRPAQEADRHPHERRGDDADRDRSIAVHEARRRRDRHQPRDHPVHRADHRRLVAEDVVPRDPHHDRDCRAHVRVDDSSRRVRARVVGVAAVEAVPAQPQKTRARHHHQQVVGGVDLPVALQSRPDHRREDEAGHPRGEMDHVAAGVVQRAVRGPVAAAPDHEGVDGVHSRDPDQHVGDPGLEVDPPEHRAEGEDRRDRGEHELEVHERGLREMEGRTRRDRRDQRLPLLCGMTQHASRFSERRPQKAVRAEDARAAVRDGFAEAHLERPQRPGDHRQAEGNEGEHHAVHRPALLHHAPIQNGQAGDAHQSQQRRGGHLPCVVAGI